MEKLKELRTLKNMTQKEVADYLAIDRTTYVKYERGQSEPTTDTLIRLAELFGVTVSEIIQDPTIENVYFRFAKTMEAYGAEEKELEGILHSYYKEHLQKNSEAETQEGQGGSKGGLRHKK